MNEKSDNSVLPSSFIGIFASDEGIQAIESPVKINILEMLKGGELPFEDLVSGAGRAKSTVSVHLKGLTDAGIIGFRGDPEDGRKKIFHINSSYLVGASAADRIQFKAERHIREFVPSEKDTADFFRFIMSTVRITLLSEGISIDPLLHMAGSRVGTRIYASVAHQDTPGMVEKIKWFWDAHALGQVELESTDPLTLNIYDCFECIDLPVTGKPVCAFEAGLLSSLFSAHFEADHNAVETRCYAMGNNSCRFELRPTQNEKP
ncbi:MAG TPA: V4R domain-containing protein [Methanoregulaceae archaeon]|nr:V4R domain-containing protein [Methanoregulaceae archaeon]